MEVAEMQLTAMLDEWWDGPAPVADRAAQSSTMRPNCHLAFLLLLYTPFDDMLSCLLETTLPSLPICYRYPIIVDLTFG